MMVGMLLRNGVVTRLECRCSSPPFRELFPYLESIHYSDCNSWDLLFSIVLGEVRDKCERWVKLPKVSVFLQGFTLNAGGTRLLAASWRFLAQNFAARPRIFTRTVSVFKNRNVMSQRRNDYSSKQIGRK